MEVVLNKLGNQPDLKQVDGLFEAIQKAKNAMQSHLSPPYEKRRKCIDCFLLALSSGKPKFATIAFEGIQLLLRESAQLGSVSDQSPEGESLIEQLLSLFANIPSWHDAPSTQCQSLTLLVHMTSSTEIHVNLRDVLNAAEICKRTFDLASDERSTSVRPAARAALTQMLHSYVQNRMESGGESAELIGASMDVTALIGELITRMGTAVGECCAEPTDNKKASPGDGNRPKLANQPLLLPLDALFSTLSALDTSLLAKHRPLLNLLKNELIPVMICHLRGSAKSSGTSLKGVGTIMGTLKRAGRISTESPSGIVPSAMVLEGVESARSFYQVVEQLLRLFAPMALASNSSASALDPSPSELLALLEELWRCALLAPPVGSRSEALRMAKRLCGQRQRFVELVQLSVISEKDSFWLLLVECVEECCVRKDGTGSEHDRRMSTDSLRTLTAMFSAISDLFASSPDELISDLFDDKLLTILAKSSENCKDELSKCHQQKEDASSSSLQQMDKAAQLFVNAFVALFCEWEKDEKIGTGPELRLSFDIRLRAFAIRICAQLNNIVFVPSVGGFEKKGSDEASTPEDSSEEDEKEAGKKEHLFDERITEIEVFGMGMEVIWTVLTEMGEAGGMAMVDNRIETIKEDAVLGEVTALTPAFIHSRLRPLLSRIIRSVHDLNPDPFAQLIFLLNLSSTDPLLHHSSSSSYPFRHRQFLFRWFRSQLHNCWSSFIRILTHFQLPNSTTKEGLCDTVEVFTVLVPLAIELGMSAELQWIFEYIGEQMCALEHLREAIKLSASKRNNEDPKNVRRFCGRAEVMAMQVLMENAIGALCIAPKVSKHVIRCVQFLWELERWHFKLVKSTIEAIYEPPALPIPPSSSGHQSPIGQLINASSALSSTELARLMDEFLTLIDRLFSNASESLPLDSFCSLLSSVCAANEDNLHYSVGLAPTESSAQLLQRLCHQLLGSMSSFPLMYKWSAWSRVRDHLIQCASSTSIPVEINRRTVDGIQEGLNVLLQNEWHQQKRDCPPTIIGWNALLFSAFPQIVQPESNCTLETCQQIGHVLLGFVEQNPELIGSGWTALFMTSKILIVRFFDSLSQENEDAEKRSSQPIWLIIELFEKFLAISSPIVLLGAYADFVDALSHFFAHSTGSNCPPALFDKLLILLERSESILLDHLFNASIPSQTFSTHFVESAENELSEMWQQFNWTMKSAGKVDSEDYLHLLVDLKAMLNESGAALDECPMLMEWLNSGEEAQNPQIGDAKVPDKTPWQHLSTIPSVGSRLVALCSIHLLQKLMNALIDSTNGGGASDGSRLALNLANFLGALTGTIGSQFSTFCFCAIVLTSLRKSIASLLTASGARYLKRLIGILCSHQSVAEMFASSTSSSAESKLWGCCLLQCLLNLAIRCVAKGGTLSLAGCALIRNICTLSGQQSPPNSDQMRAKCAIAIWHSTCYALFPVRMLIAQFFARSNDFAGDLGQMRVSYRLGLSPLEVEERVDNVHQLANQILQLEDQQQNLKAESDHQSGGGTLIGSGRRESATGGAHFPSKFAYLFVFEDVERNNQSAGAKKLSMGLDELVESLLCQQLLIQLVSEQFDFSSTTSSNPINVPLLATLNASLAICRQFELRPGLKSLLQKLTGLPLQANLWRMALPTLGILLRWHLHQAVAQQDEQKGKHLKKICWLLWEVGGREGNGVGQVTGQREKMMMNGNGAGAKNEQQLSNAGRANPFISSQSSIEASKEIMAKIVGGASTESAMEEENNEVRSLAFKQLLGSFCADVLDLLNDAKDAKIVNEMLAQLEQSGGDNELEKQMMDELLIGRVRAVIAKSEMDKS